MIEADTDFERVPAVRATSNEISMVDEVVMVAHVEAAAVATVVVEIVPDELAVEVVFD